MILFRDDWIRHVSASRSATAGASLPENANVALMTSIAQIYRDTGQIELLAMFFNSIGNVELRDKCIDEIMSADPDDQSIVFFRSMQGRTDLIPQEVIDREELSLADNPSQRARLYAAVGRSQDAVREYLRGALQDLDDDNPFAAAFYLKELFDEGLVDDLFKMAFDESIADHDLWWAIRALEELGWEEPLRELVLSHADEIDSGDLLLLQHLRRVRGDADGAAEIAKTIARGTRKLAPGIDGIPIRE